MGSRIPSSSCESYRSDHFLENSVPGCRMGMKFAAKAVVRPSVLVPSIMESGISMRPTLTSESFPSPLMMSSSTFG